MSDSKTRGRPPWSRRSAGAAKHAAGQGGVTAPAGVTGDQPRAGGGGRGLGPGLAGVWAKIQMLNQTFNNNPVNFKSI